MRFEIRLVAAASAVALTLAACGGDDDGDGGGDGAAADASVNQDPDGSVTDDPDAGAPDAGGLEGVALHSILSGTFDEFLAYQGIRDVRGRAQLVRTADGDTRVELQALGLVADTAYPAHVHNQPCAFGDGGTHYLIDPAAAPGESNEIWVPFTTDADGVGHGSATVGHLARGDALSVVIHDPVAGNAKMACADLLADEAGDVVAAGSFAPFAAADTIDQTIGGSVAMVRRSASTAVIASWTGLTGSEVYSSHVHAQPCGVIEADGHYKRDPTNPASLEANELWLTIEDHEDGEASQTIVFEGHVARADAQSVVVHRDGLKVACADLERTSHPPLVTEGNASLFATAIERGYTALTGHATMARRLDGLTWVELRASGLTPGGAYGAHVHAHACDVSEGGGHYEIDPSVEGVVEENEIWVNLTAGDDGAAASTALAAHTARPEAQSIVLHDEDGARLFCIDLE